MAEAQWYAVTEADGTLVSIGTVIADPLPEGMVAHKIPARPTEPSTWNKTTFQFELKPEPPPKVDRLAEVLDRVAADGTDLEAILVELLGDARWRHHDEPFGLSRRGQQLS